MNGWVTASHCSTNWLGADSTYLGQPSPWNTGGMEFYDLPYFTYLIDARCPVGKKCRYSDASFFAANDGINYYYATTPGYNYQSPVYWRLAVGETWTPPAGTITWFTGMTSGTGLGLLDLTCATVNAPDSHTFFCQNVSNGNPAQAGDSGAPVLIPNSSGESLAGILWGG